MHFMALIPLSSLYCAQNNQNSENSRHTSVYEIAKMVSPRIIPWTEITGNVLHIDVLEDSINLAINMQKIIHITLPKGEIIKKPSIIEAGSSISILRTHS